jgi:transaldolase/glucose-6-phosphate isomerase
MERVAELTVDLTLPSAGLAEAVEERLRAWEATRFAERLWEKDPTLWAPDGAPFPSELADRLGWLDLPDQAAAEAAELAAFAAEVRRDGLERVVVLGMGGSSLAPEVFQRVFGGRPGQPELAVLDSTHPEAVRAARERLDPASTLFLVASKSGTTVETLALFRYFWAEVAAEVGGEGPEAGRRFAAITDPGTPLADLAGERGFRRVFLAPADVGGRYSALSVFGLVPAALLGVDLGRLAPREGFRAPVPENPGLRLGALLAEAERARDKVTLLASPGLAALPVWIEQLVAASLGKDGRGLVPVVDEPKLAPGEYHDDRLFVHLGLAEDGAGSSAETLAALERSGHPVARIVLRDRHGIGGCMLLWEVAVAAAGAALGVNPFDQPDVELAKRRAKEAMAGAGGAAGRGEVADEVDCDDAGRLRQAIERWIEPAGPGRYAAIQAFLPPDSGTDHGLQELRLLLADRTGIATTSGYGPRFLHSTGQLHKGGPATGLFLQLVDEPPVDRPVPGAGHGFGDLIRAQAIGDYLALRERGRAVLRVQLGGNRTLGLARVRRALDEALGEGV